MWLWVKTPVSNGLSTVGWVAKYTTEVVGQWCKSGWMIMLSRASVTLLVLALVPNMGYWDSILSILFKWKLHWWFAKGTVMRDSAFFSSKWLMRGFRALPRRCMLPSRSATSGVKDGQRTATSGMVFQPGRLSPELRFFCCKRKVVYGGIYSFKS